MGFSNCCGPNKYNYSSAYTDNGCKKCLRSSPVPSLVGMVFVLLGGTAFGTGVIFARSFLFELISNQEILPYLDYTVYGLVGAIALFTILAYLLCALSSGQNAKDCFDTSGKSTCGRCCNMFLILCLFCGVLLWIGIVCLLAYSVISISFLTHRQVSLGESSGISMNNAFDKEPTATRVARQADDIGFITASEGPITPLKMGTIDLSYYGFIIDGEPVTVSSKKFDKLKEKLILCMASSTIGTLLMLFGYMMITICVAMNYSRLQEFRYYDIDNCNYEESAALRS